MAIRLIVTINKCIDCHHKNHTGGFTRGGAKPCCDHNETIKKKGSDCFKRILPVTGNMPGWCPLRKASNRIRQTVSTKELTETKEKSCQDYTN